MAKYIIKLGYYGQAKFVDLIYYCNGTLINTHFKRKWIFNYVRR